jgi:hypothetical protein
MLKKSELEREKRRSQRVKVRVPVAVRLQLADKRIITETTEALVVSAHGGLILLTAEVFQGDFVTLSNPTTEKEMLGRVTDVGARIMGKVQVGIEFIKPAPEFWGIKQVSQT